MGEVMALAYLVNANTDYCTMIRYSGHVDAINIRVFPNKEHCTEDEPIYVSDFYVDGKHGCDPERELLELKATLEGYIFPHTESTRP